MLHIGLPFGANFSAAFVYTEDTALIDTENATLIDAKNATLIDAKGAAFVKTFGAPFVKAFRPQPPLPGFQQVGFEKIGDYHDASYHFDGDAYQNLVDAPRDAQGNQGDGDFGRDGRDVQISGGSGGVQIE